MKGFARYGFAIRNGIFSEFVIRQAIANCLNIGYGLQIRSQREMCNSHLQCSLKNEEVNNERLNHNLH